MTPPLTIVRCPKCGDPSPWHRDLCELTWRVGDREATAQFHSPKEAAAAARRVRADSEAHDLVLYDLEGEPITRPCAACGAPLPTWTITDPATGDEHACCDDCYRRLRTLLED